MAEYVEARSLTALNALASNPPQYPTNPTEKKQDPLTLYISRVPGARDIILSTYRPQIKNVTAEDVASSLYYVHLNTPEDEALASDSHIDNPASRQSLDSLRNVNLINRKPVPNHQANLSSIKEPVSRMPQAISSSLPGEQNQRYNEQSQFPTAQPDQRNPTGQLHSQRARAGSIQRKPLGPRTLGLNTQDTSLPGPSPYEYISLPPRPDEIDNLPDPAVFAPPQPVRPSSRTPSPSKRKPFKPFSVTLIRRDPSSSQQWNIGQVASFQLEHPEQIQDDKHIPSPSINIHLETPGYLKFRGMPAPGTSFDINEIRESLDMIRPGSSSAAAGTSQSPMRQRAKPEHASPTSSNSFERQVKMTYGPSFGATIRNAFRRLDSKDDGLPTSPRRPSHDRQPSALSVGSFGGDFDGGEAPIITVPSHGLKSQGYVFFSPWDGRCEFRTGNGGRTLRCRHMLPNVGQWNPLVDGGSGDGQKGHRRTGSKSPNSKGHDISELRFNLPSSEIFIKGEKPLEGRERTRDRIFNQMINKTEEDVEDEEYENYGFDLSLGKEKAGGGNRGKRAKMGKLIIWDDGLKMLDLVVAANVGIWWSVWERRSE